MPSMAYSLPHMSQVSQVGQAQRAMAPGLRHGSRIQPRRAPHGRADAAQVDRQLAAAASAAAAR